jgi:hypothetical protein
VRERYLRRRSELPDDRPPPKQPAHDPETGEITDYVAKEAQEAERRHQEALADPTGHKAEVLLAQRLGERQPTSLLATAKVMGLI